MSQHNSRIRADHWLVTILFSLMALIAFLNVVSRYLLHFSFSATEEITINLFVWVTVIGSGIAFERGGQLGMVTLYNIFPPRFKRGVILFSAALSAVLFILVDIYTIQAIYDEVTIFNATSPALGIPVWIYYIGVPVLSIFVFVGICRDATTRLSGLPAREAT
jgi:TRAP-type C4-dicarboxylate transport system permease small subunit